MAVLQVALDFVDLERALQLAREAVEGGADWVEAGTPLLKSAGVDAIRRLRAEFPRAFIVADTKTMDAGRTEMEIMSKAGANAAVCLGVASDATIRECIEAGRNYGLKVGVDLIGVADPVARAQQAAEWGAEYVILHCGIDQQMQGQTPFQVLRDLAERSPIKVAVAGGITSETVVDAVANGAQIVIVGGAIIKSPDARKATAEMVRAMKSGVRAATDHFKRAGADRIREALMKVSSANVSDGGHRMPCLEGIRPLAQGMKLVGKVLTVRTYPGDWSKPVQAIDQAEPGDVIVIDAGGRPPAVWGELATNSCIQRGIAGVVIDGAIRDTGDIRRLGFPAFARHVVPNAGEPKGFGEIGVPITISGIHIDPGDWLIGDDDGIIILPKARAVELANYALDCLERENRIRQEIESGKTTLGQVTQLLRWEKVG